MDISCAASVSYMQEQLVRRARGDRGTPATQNRNQSSSHRTEACGSIWRTRMFSEKNIVNVQEASVVFVCPKHVCPVRMIRRLSLAYVAHGSHRSSTGTQRVPTPAKSAVATYVLRIFPGSHRCDRRHVHLSVRISICDLKPAVVRPVLCIIWETFMFIRFRQPAKRTLWPSQHLLLDTSCASLLIWIRDSACTPLS